MAPRKLLVLLVLGACGGCASGRQAGGSTSPDPLRDRKAEELFAQGKASAEQGDTVRAEEYLELAIDRGYDRRKALPLLLGACLSSGRLRAALNYAEPELRLNPDDTELRYLVASIRLGLGQASEAKDELEAVLRENPNHANAHYLLGVVESDDLRDRDSSKAHLQKYLALAPSGKHAPEVQSRLSEMDAREIAIASEPQKPEDNRFPRYEPSAIVTPPAPSVATPESNWFDGQESAR